MVIHDIVSRMNRIAYIRLTPCSAALDMRQPERKRRELHGVRLLICMKNG